MYYFKKTQNWFAIILLIVFFLPWWKGPALHPVSVSGFEYYDFIKNLIKSVGINSSVPLKAYALYIYPILTIIILFTSLIKIDTRIISLLTGILSLFYITWAMLKLEGILSPDYGIYLNAIASLGLIIGALFIDKKSKQK
mgnify:CR=1 FL=1